MGRASWYDEDGSDSSYERRKGQWWIDEGFEEDLLRGEYVDDEISSLPRSGSVAEPQLPNEGSGSIEGGFVLPNITSLTKSVEEMKTELQELKSLIEVAVYEGDVSSGTSYEFQTMLLILVCIVAAMGYRAIFL